MDAPGDPDTLNINLKFFQKSTVDISNFASNEFRILDPSLVDLTNDRFDFNANQDFALRVNRIANVDVSFTDLAGQAIIPA